MYWRPLRAADLPACLEIQHACLGEQIVGHATALRIWNGLLTEPSFQATVIESQTPIAGQKIMGCGMGVFVSAKFADAEIAQPRPGINSRIVASIASGNSVLLGRLEIGKGNANSGLDFVNLYGTWREGILSPAQLPEVHALLGTSFVEHLAGYRFNRVLKEAIGASGIAFARATGTYRLIAEFPQSESALAVLNPECGLSAPYSVAAAVYRYQKPVLHFRQAEQDLLVAALSGNTDAELSAKLSLSIEAVKKRFLSIYARVDQFKPDILDQSGAESEVRGPQKRHRVLAYVRAHPEELRPFFWDHDTK